MDFLSSVTKISHAVHLLFRKVESNNGQLETKPGLFGKIWPCVKVLILIPQFFLFQ